MSFFAHIEGLRPEPAMPRCPAQVMLLRNENNVDKEGKEKKVRAHTLCPNQPRVENLTGKFTPNLFVAKHFPGKEGFGAWFCAEETHAANLYLKERLCVERTHYQQV